MEYKAIQVKKPYKCRASDCRQKELELESNSFCLQSETSMKMDVFCVSFNLFT